MARHQLPRSNGCHGEGEAHESRSAEPPTPHTCRVLHSGRLSQRSLAPCQLAPQHRDLCQRSLKSAIAVKACRAPAGGACDAGAELDGQRRAAAHGRGAAGCAKQREAHPDQTRLWLSAAAPPGPARPRRRIARRVVMQRYELGGALQPQRLLLAWRSGAKPADDPREGATALNLGSGFGRRDCSFRLAEPVGLCLAGVIDERRGATRRSVGPGRGHLGGGWQKRCVSLPAE